MTLADVYQSRKLEGQMGKIARDLLEQTHWFTTNAEFDPKTGAALPQALSAFLAKVAEPKPSGRAQDRLYRITEHARPAVERLLRILNESPRREHALLPVRAVRELDVSCFMKLSTRPGRTIREKLAGKPYLQAVRHYQSVDLAENRLLKAYAYRLADLLEFRREQLDEAEDPLLPKIRLWILSDAAKAISQWENLPPNNTLLSHRDYRRVWDSWRRLQTLDSDIARDLSRLDERRDTMRRWMDYGKMYRDGAHLFAEMPVLFDYDDFSIRTWQQRDPLVQRSRRRQRRCYGEKSVAEPACVDFSEMRPRYAVTPEYPEVLTEAFLWQQWRNAAETVDIMLFNADAAYLHPDATTIGCSDLFFTDEGTTVHCDLAARAFASRLRDTFTHDKIIWLVPDALNDFELEVVRRNLNARFPGAEPLPRSIAALFEQIDYTQIKQDGYSVLVVDTLGGTTCATRLIARRDPALKRRLPETEGFYWERCPPVMISEPDAGENRLCDIVTVDGNGKWHNSAAPKRPVVDSNQLKADPRIGNWEVCINISESPVAGGMRLYAMQSRAGELPLWRDQIPELSIKAYIDGFWGRFPLVRKKTPIPPVRGARIPIEIRANFPLPAGKPFYSFPLYKGEAADEMGFSARLDSSQFPLEQETECKLILTFEYGADEPYCLTFFPFDKSKSILPIRATWIPTDERSVINAPGPGYPERMSWKDLESMPKPGSEQTTDLLEWLCSEVERLDRALFIQPPRMSDIQYTRRRGASSQNADDTQLISFDERVTEDFVKRIRKRLYVPFIQVWKDGRSLTDDECPRPFVEAAKERIAYLTELVNRNAIPSAVKREILFLLSCLHKDTPNECIEWIYNQVESRHIIDPKAVGFALGDVSEVWQTYIFETLAEEPSVSVVRIFAYAIWRERHFVERFTVAQLEIMLNCLLRQMSTLQPKPQKDGTLRLPAAPLELLLGLLRTRGSPDPDIQVLLQPHQKIAKELAKQLDRVEEMFAKGNITLSSRIQLNIQKPRNVRTPDLLFALRLYLTGDNGAHAIHVTRIADSENE